MPNGRFGSIGRVAGANISRLDDCRVEAAHSFAVNYRNRSSRKSRCNRVDRLDLRKSLLGLPLHCKWPHQRRHRHRRGLTPIQNCLDNLRREQRQPQNAAHV